MRRRLAAVMAADIVGYTRMMGADQDGALADLRAFRADVFDPTVRVNQGQIIKSMGDGWLVEFASSVDAVKCALAVQDHLYSHTNLRLRIGVNIGDIIHEADDIFGDGVNVAARLQDIAAPGGIALSGGVHDTLDQSVGAAFQDAGLRTLKNVARKIHVWMLASAGQTDAMAVPNLRLVNVAVLPINRPIDRPELLDLTDALSADISRLISTTGWIAARPTENQTPDGYSLQASLRARAGQIRLEVQLHNPTGQTEWKGAFDGDLADSFGWQDKTAMSVAADVVGVVSDHLRQSPDKDPLLQGVLEFHEISAFALGDSLTALSRGGPGPAAVQALRIAGVAMVTGYADRLGPLRDQIPQWIDLAQAEGDAAEPLCRTIWAYLKAPDPQPLSAALGQVPADSPDPVLQCLAGWGHVWLGNALPATLRFQYALDHAPLHPVTMAIRAGMAVALVQSGHDHRAIEQASAILTVSRDFDVPFYAIAAAAAHLDRMTVAREAAHNAQNLEGPGGHAFTGFKDPGADRFLQGLKMVIA